MSNTQPVISRRTLLKNVAGPSAAAMLLPRTPSSRARASVPLPVLSQPDMMIAFAGDVEAGRFQLSRSGLDWTPSSGTVETRITFAAGSLHSTISLESPTTLIQRVHLRWKCKFPSGVLALGDAWERSYGDLEWRPFQAERAMPWYAMLHFQGQTTGMGVKTGAASFAFWQIDLAGISLWLDVRNGGNGVQLGNRKLNMATIVQYAGDADEDPFSCTRHLCRLMAQGTRVPQKRGTNFVDVIYGSNDWYYAYGHNTADRILRDADLVKSLAPAQAPLPFTVIDDGYQDHARFPDMAKLASDIRSRGVIPGLWIRPLRADNTVPANLLLPDARCKGIGSNPSAL